MRKQLPGDITCWKAWTYYQWMLDTDVNPKLQLSKLKLVTEKRLIFKLQRFQMKIQKKT